MLGGHLNKRCCFTCWGFPIIKVRQLSFLWWEYLYLKKQPLYWKRTQTPIYFSSRHWRSGVPWYVVTTHQRLWQAYLPRKLPEWSHSQSHLHKERCKHYYKLYKLPWCLCVWLKSFNKGCITLCEIDRFLLLEITIKFECWESWIISIIRCGWGLGSFSKVVVTFNHVDRFFNLSVQPLGVSE